MMALLIPLGDAYVSPAHIVEVVVHPVARDICVILTNGREIRIPAGDGVTKEAALHRVVQHIRNSANA